MDTILKYTEWTSASGRTYCEDVSDIAGGSAKMWWLPARMLNLSIEEYLLLLKGHGADHFKYNKEKNVLLYSWSEPEKCHKFVLYINREAKKRNFKIQAQCKYGDIPVMRE